MVQEQDLEADGSKTETMTSQDDEIKDGNDLNGTISCPEKLREDTDPNLHMSNSN